MALLPSRMTITLLENIQSVDCSVWKDKFDCALYGMLKCLKVRYKQAEIETGN